MRRSALLSIFLIIIGFLMIIVSIIIDWVRLDSSIGFGLKQLILLSAGIFVLLTGVIYLNLWQLTATKVWRVISIPFFLVGALGGSIIFALVLMPVPSYTAQAELRSLLDKRPLEPERVTILVDSKEKKAISVTSDKAAVVLIDVRQDNNGEFDDCYKNIGMLLDRAREHGLTIIHAPSYQIARRYPQCRALHREVEAFLRPSFFEKLLSRYCLAIEKERKLKKWPQEVNASAKKLKPAAHKFSWKTLAKPTASSPKDDIALFSRPRDDEFVISTEEELRYVLWRRQIEVLLYVGQRTNGCILDRPAGILNLRGSNYTIVLVGDCSAPSPFPGYSVETVQKVFEEYYKRIGFVTYLKNIAWDRM